MKRINEHSNEGGELVHTHCQKNKTKNHHSLLSDTAVAEIIICLPTVSIVSLSSIRSWALGISMCMRSVCCCLFIGSAGRVFLLQQGWRRVKKALMRHSLTVNSTTDLVQILTSSASQPNFLHLQMEEKTHIRIAGTKWRLKRVAPQSL